MKPAILISASDYEPAVAYFYPYALKAIEIARNLDYPVEPALRTEQTQDGVFRRAPKCALILHNGHGNDNETTGHGTVVIWSTCNYPTSTVEKKIIFLLSCLCGKGLAPDMARKGASAVLAWDEVYIFNARGDPDPLKDPLVQLFFMPILQGFQKVLQGYPAGEWKNTIVSEYAKAISNPNVPPHVQSNLAWDANHLVLCGDPNARITEVPPSPPPGKKKFKVVLKMEKDLTGYVYVGRFKLPVYIYAQGTNIAGEAEEE